MGDLVSEWVERGKQRRAVFEALRVPRTGGQILRFALAITPKITFQDVRHILRKLGRLGGVVCLNPRERTGRIYVRSGIELGGFRVNWETYCCVARAKARASVLVEVGRQRIQLLKRPATATGIKNRLRQDYPMSLNLAIESLHDLKRRGLVDIIDRLPAGDRKVYGLTERGKLVVELLEKANSVPDTQHSVLPPP